MFAITALKLILRADAINFIRAIVAIAYPIANPSVINTAGG